MAFRGAHIQVDHVSHAYRRGGALAIRDIEFQVSPGEALVLVGRSGCGKSTLLQILCGLLNPARGRVLIDGHVIDAPSPDWVMMFQAPSLYPWMTVEQNVALGLRFSGRSREIATRVPEMLELVELSAFAKRNVQDLSGGQQQRVALARSLAPNPHVLLLDEPLSALDAFTRHALQRDIRRIAAEMGITLVLVSHDIQEAVMMADRALVLSANPGEIFAEIEIPIPGERLPNTPEFTAARQDLVRAYEAAAGLAMADVDRLDGAPETASAIPSTDKNQPSKTASASAGR
ncbi:ABC transporter ATP-binding protein [Amorphus orientalis]|uniref:NitT/TauT family transport system ATP-binding protein n=1 Tax=Amorphus orientalis TaxID=649198 RepID=A0AAE4AS24_9HYPH|nr:ABC transporter ATP-binding protein [Amorphus orientalis]MDQ0315761.1 NitT/TauT family transport system ATP-binding protein [Amorphus orientalis]